MKTRTLNLIALTAAFALAACGSEPENTVELNNSANATELENIAEPEAPLPVNNTAEAPPVSLEFDDAQQMQDDADATGMTSRLPRESDAPATPAPAPPAQ